MSANSAASRFKRLARRVARPVASPIDGRVADINRRIGYQGERAQERIVHLEEELGQYAIASADATTFVGVELRRLTDTVERMREQTLLESFHERLAHARDAPLSELDEQVAWLLNHAAGHRGYAAQAELWFNPPVTVELGAGTAHLAGVNERIVEMPFAMGALGRVAPPARVLDIGSAESTFPLSAASLGYDTTAIDLRPLPYSHPRLTTFAGRFEDWSAPEQPFDAAFLISTIEHVGLGAYGETAYGDAEPGEGADRELVERIGSLLAPGGLLVLTTPFGPRSVSDFERIYDLAALDRLLADWTIEERRIVIRRDELIWTAEPEPGPEDRGVAMVVATRG